MSGGSKASVLDIYNKIRFRASLAAATWFGIRAATAPSQNIEVILPSTQPAQSTDQIMIFNGTQAGGYQISWDAKPTGTGGGEANTASSPSTAIGALSIYWRKQGVDLQFFKLLPLTAVNDQVGDGVSFAQGIDTIDIKVDKRLKQIAALANPATEKILSINTSGNIAFTDTTTYQAANSKLANIAGLTTPAAIQWLRLNTDGTISAFAPPVAATTSVDGFMSAADKTKLNSIAASATANDTDANLKNRANHTGTQDWATITGVPSYQASSTRLTALAGFSNPATVKLTQLGTDGVLTLVDPPTGFNPGSQNANVFYASPNGSAGNPIFRSLVWGDVSGFTGTTATSYAVGNDSRFHTRNQDTGTNSTTFTLDTAGTPLVLKDVAGALQVRNGTDTDFADFSAKNVSISGNLTVTGNTIFVQPETVQVQDNILELNSNFTTGSPTEDLGISALRGSSPAAQMLFNEAADKWQAGESDNMISIARVVEGTFTNGNLTAGILTVTHNLRRLRPSVTITDNNGDEWSIVDRINVVSINQLTVDMTTLGTIAGTWGVTLIG